MRDRMLTIDNVFTDFRVNYIMLWIGRSILASLGRKRFLLYLVTNEVSSP